MCSKVGFYKKEAQTVLNQAKKNHRPEVRIYECPICLANKKEKVWHLSSKEEWEEPIYLKEKDLIFADKWKTLIGN